jgi:hypothetical protein
MSSYRNSNLVVAILATLFAVPSWAGLRSLTQISVDTSANPGADTTVQHRTEVAPRQAVFAQTIVTTFQDGVVSDFNGGSQVGWATSLDGGRTWQHGYIPGTTSYFWEQAVSFDLKHHTWLIILNAQDMNAQDADGNYLSPTQMQVSRSNDGIHWSAPSSAYGPISYSGSALGPQSACDNNRFSPHFGNCYLAWSNFDGVTGASTDDVSVSTDGGVTWSAPAASPDQCAGTLGAMVIQPNGHVLLVGAYDGCDNIAYLYSIASIDGGETLQTTVDITAEQLAYPTEGGVMRQDPFPSAAVSLDGTISVVTYDCRFRAGCATNDIVMTTSKDGMNWTPIARIPIDSVDSGVDHFVAGIGAPGFFDIFWGASPSEVAVNYYYSPNATTCVPSSTVGCQLYAGFISSNDCGMTWSEPTRVFGPMNIATDLATTAFGQFVADFMTLIYVDGQPQAAYSLARPYDAKTDLFNQAIYSARFEQGGWF